MEKPQIEDKHKPQHQPNTRRDIYHIFTIAQWDEFFSYQNYTAVSIMRPY